MRKMAADAIYGLPPYVFVMLGLYAGLRREEILGLQWDSVYLDCEAPYLTVRRAWHTEHNRPVILTELKTKAAHRNVPLPDNLLECLKERRRHRHQIMWLQTGMETLCPIRSSRDYGSIS